MAKMFDFLLNNLVHVAPILVCGGIGLAIIFERLKALSWSYPIPNQAKFFEKLRDLVMSDRLAESIALCDKYPGKPVAQVVREALLRAHQPEPLIEDGLQIAVTEANERVQARTTYLATIANVSTLLGLFGTILGLIHSFEAVGSANAQQKAALLAAGISTAMNATMLGLGVAIPCMIAFSILMNKTNHLSSDVEKAAVKIMDLIRQRYYAAEAETAPDAGQPGKAA